MITKELLQKFCALEDRVGLDRPWSHLGYSWAGCGRILLRCLPVVPGVSVEAPIGMAAVGRLNAFFRDLPSSKRIRLPQLPDPLPMTCCLFCAGRGIGTCTHCNGLGERPRWQRIRVGLQMFDSELLRKLEVLPNVTCAPPRAADEAMSFYFDGGIGLLMALTPEPGDAR